MNKGAFFIVHAIIFVLIIIICYLILFFLPNILYLWKGVTEVPIVGGAFLPPATLVVVLEPLYLPLTGDHTLFTLLHTTEETTGLEIQELLAYAVYSGSPIVTANGKTVDVKDAIQKEMKFIIPEGSMGYNLVVISEDAKIFSVGTRDFETKYFSSTTLTLPDLRKVEVYLYIG